MVMDTSYKSESQKIPVVCSYQRIGQWIPIWGRNAICFSVSVSSEFLQIGYSSAEQDPYQNAVWFELLS